MGLELLDELKKVKYVSKDYDCDVGETPFVYFSKEKDLSIKNTYVDLNPANAKPLNNLVNAIEQFIESTYGFVKTVKGDIVNHPDIDNKLFTLIIKDYKNKSEIEK